VSPVVALGKAADPAANGQRIRYRWLDTCISDQGERIAGGAARGVVVDRDRNSGIRHYTDSG